MFQVPRFKLQGSRLFLFGLALGDDFDGGGGDGGLVGGDQRQVVGQVLEEEIAILDFHGGPDVDLDSENSFESAALFVEVDGFGRWMAVDPVLMVIAAHKDAEVVPLAGLEISHWEVVNNPRLPFAVDDHFFAGVGEDAPSTLLVEHAVVVCSVRDHVALIAGDNAIAEIGAVLAAIVDAAVATRGDFDLHAELEVFQLAAAPDDEAVVLQRAVGDAGEAAVFNAPIVWAAFPVGEVTAVEDGAEAGGRRGGLSSA